MQLSLYKLFIVYLLTDNISIYFYRKYSVCYASVEDFNYQLN